jgi:uncharacterized protein YbbK (DUF523 family)
MNRVLVSACLLGSPVRPDGGDKKLDHPVIRRWLEEGRIVSVCPEVLGGLPTPRPPAEIVPGGRRQPHPRRHPQRRQPVVRLGDDSRRQLPRQQDPGRRRDRRVAARARHRRLFGG